MAIIHLKGSSLTIPCDKSDAEYVSSLLMDRSNHWRDIIKIDNYTFQLSDVKLIEEDTPIIVDNSYEKKLIEYNKGREEFIKSDIETKIKNAWSMFGMFWIIMRGSSVEQEPELERIKKWYHKLAEKWYTDNPERTIISLKFLTKQYSKHFRIKRLDDEKKKSVNLKNAIRSAAIRIYNTAEINDINMQYEKQ